MKRDSKKLKFTYNKEFLEAVLDNAPIPIWVKETDTTHVYGNKAYYELMRPQAHSLKMPSTKDAILGKTDHEMAKEGWWSKDYADYLVREDTKIAKKGSGIFHVELEGPWVDGFTYITDTIRTPLKNSKGEVTHIIIAMYFINKLRRIESISRIKEKVRKLPGMSAGLDLVLNSALSDLSMDIGIVLTLDQEENLARLQAFRSQIEGLELNESYPLDGGFIELEVIKEEKEFSKALGASETQILGTRSISCVPVYLGRKLCGILALGDSKGKVLNEDWLDILKEYGNLVSTVFETETLNVKPLKESVTRKETQFKLEPGYSYLIKDKTEKAFEVFLDQVLGGSEGLCITREFPPRIRERYGLTKTPVVWLNEERVVGETTVHSLQDLSLLLSQFLQKAKRGLVLFESFEYLIINHGFKPFIQFLQLARGRIERSNGNLIAPILEGALDQKEERLLEKEMKSFQIN